MILNKKAEGFLGMSFSMIFSIILIVFFVIAAFIGIRAFMGWQQTAQIGMFMDDLEFNVNEAWNCADSCSFPFNSSLPVKIEAVCFANMSAPKKEASDLEEDAYNYVSYSSLARKPTDNFFVYSPKMNYGLNNRYIKHLDLSEHNPVCFKVVNGKVSIRIEKRLGSPLVRVY